MKQKILALFIFSSSWLFNISLHAAFSDALDSADETEKRVLDPEEKNEDNSSLRLKRRKIQHDETVALVAPIEKAYKAVLVPDKSGDFIQILPKESSIKKAVSQKFIPSFIKLEKLSICPYATNSIVAAQIKKLPIFKEFGQMIPAMKKGHVKLSSEDGEYIGRGYIITNDENIVQGCINLSLYMNTHSCVIESLGIDPKSPANGLGSSLLQTAICVASLYGCDHVDVQGTPESIGVYAKHGFWFCEKGYDEENIAWKDFANLHGDVMLELAEENNYFMKLNFEDDKHLEILDRYMARHAKPVISLSNLIKGNRETLSNYQRQFENIEAMIDQEDEESKALAREKIEGLSEDVEFPENILKLCL